MCDIIYCHFQQDGIATLWAGLMAMVVGIAAVIGAVVVGLRQTRILKEQTAIQDRQVDIARLGYALEERRLRADLYERRLTVFNAVSGFIGYIRSVGRIPGIDSDNQGMIHAPEICSDFLSAKGASEFLFHPSVSVGLEHLWKASLAMSKAREDVVYNQSHGEPEEQKLAQDRLSAANQTIRVFGKNIRELFNELNIAGHEGLGGQTTTSGDA